MTVIDIHTHSLSENWLNLVRKKGKPDLAIGTRPNGNEFLIEFGTPSMGLNIEGMFDYQRRIRDMDAEGIDISIVSLTSPNTFWGTEDNSIECAQIMNDDMAAAQQSYLDRIRFFASLPWGPIA